MNRKICVIVPSLQMGGMERVASLLANYANRSGYQVFIVCLITSKAAYKIDDEIIVCEPPFYFSKKKFGKLSVLHYLYKQLKNINPDVSLSFSEHFNPLAIIASRLAGKKLYISDRSSPQKKIRYPIQALRKLLYPLADGMISQTQLAKEVAMNNGYNKNIAVIPNPLKDFPVNSHLNKKNIIISVGRLTPSKNHKELIEMFNSADSKKKWELWIVGDGPEKAALTAEIIKLKLEDRVHLIGAVDDVDYYLSKSSIFAFASLSEGFPNALSEAIATPLPCIAYDIPAGPSELIINKENGFLVPMSNKNEYINKLKLLIESEDLRKFFIRNYTLHRQKFDMHNISKKYLDFIFRRKI